MDRFRWAFAWALVVMLACTCGCGESRRPAGRVSGKVTSASGAVAEANVQFVRPDGVPVGAAKVGDSGEFTFHDPLPVGEYRVAVLPIVQVASAEDVDPRHKEVMKKIPSKYWDSHTSGLTTVVKEGDNSVTFTLK